MANKTKILFHPNYPIGDISPRLYGGFLEPIGTMVNGSMYNPKHPTADASGFRRDFIDALKASGIPCVRLPGGNFISGWDWKDSIGPREQRKGHLDLAWFQYYTNDIGHDEYLRWAQLIGTEPLYTINLGTGNMNDALSIVEYTNHEGGTYWSDLRAKYGHKDSYGVKIWYLGNEMDGPWQIASWQKDPRGYGVLAHETSKAMKWVDPTIETVVCASSSPHLPHYPQWDLEVLQECYESVDYVSLHHYHSAPEENYAALMGGSVYFEEYINTEIALCDFIQTKMRSPRKMMISFDEYGTMARPSQELHPGYGPHNLAEAHKRVDPLRKYVRHDPDNMALPPYKRGKEMIQALTSASTILAFLRHADRVKIGCMTSGLSAAAATSRENVWKSAVYYPFTQLMRYGKGVSLTPSVVGDTFDIPGYAMDDSSQNSDKTGVPFIDTAAAYNEPEGELTVFAINRDWEHDREIELDMSAFAGYKFVEHIQLYSDDPDARNTFEAPDTIAPTVNDKTTCKDGKLSADLKKLSWNVFRFEK